jgi:hypothetical protein
MAAAVTGAAGASGIPEALDRELVDVYRAWDAVEQSRHHTSIIDFDLAAPRPVTAAASRAEVATRLQRLASRLDGLPQYWRALVAARIRASLYFLRALNGETIPLHEYVEATMGVVPRMFSEEEIAERRADVARSLQELSQPSASSDMDPGPPPWPPILFRAGDFDRFQEQFIVRDSRVLPDHFARYRDKWLPRLLRQIDVPIEAYRIEVEFASEDAYWKNWISGNLSGHQINLRINTHPRHSWYAGAAETLALHEYCGHAIQMINWHRRIERRELPEFAGILTVHFPDQFVLEGLAETMAYLLPAGSGTLDRKSKVLRDLHAYTLMVSNNVHIIANEEEPDAALAYASPLLPFTTTDSIRADIRDRVNHPLYRCYQYVYGIAKYTFLQALDCGTEGVPATPRDWRLIKQVYSDPMTPRQFSALQEIRRN